MKKFTFSLQKLLNFREQVFDIERATLAEMHAVLDQLKQNLHALKDELHRSSQELNQRYIEGITSLEIMQHKTYLQALGETIVAVTQQIELQQQAIDRQTDKVREAKIEINTMEKLKEKKLDDYNYEVRKADEQFIEEFVSNQRAMSTAS